MKCFRAMKKCLLLFSVLMLTGLTAFAFEYTHAENTLEYTILTDSTVSVKKSTTTLSGTLVIPAQVVDPGTGKTYSVTHVAAEGFRYVESINSYTSIVFPEGLQEIGGKAFVHCTNIVSEVTLPSTLTKIGSRAFYNCQNIVNLIITSPNPPELITSYNGVNDDDWFATVDKITIPAKQGVRYRHSGSGNWASMDIDKNAPFVDPSESLVDNLYYRIEDNTAILSGAAYMNTFILNIPANININSVNYPVKEIADSAFLGNDNLLSLNIPEGITRIGEKGFCKARGLNGIVTLPQSLNRIDYRAFYVSKNIEKFIIKSPSITIEKQVFDGTGESPLYVHCDYYNDYMSNWGEWTSRIRNACLHIYHNGTTIPSSDNGVYATEETIVSEIIYKRIFTPNKWETLYLPFEVSSVTVTEDGVEYLINPWDVNSGGNFYLAEEDGTQNGILYFTTTTSLNSATPYIIQFPDEYYRDKVVTFYGPASWMELEHATFTPTVATTDMQFVGNTTYQNQMIEDDIYLLRATDDFMLQKETTSTLYPFECYVTLPESQINKLQVRLRGSGNGVSTSIDQTPFADSNIFYTIDGTNLTISTQGQSIEIYAINGSLVFSIDQSTDDVVSLDLEKGCYILYSNGNSQKIVL